MSGFLFYSPLTEMEKKNVFVLVIRFHLEMHVFSITLYNLQPIQVRNCSTEDSKIMEIPDQ